MSDVVDVAAAPAKPEYGIVWVNKLPEKLPWIEGVDYLVVAPIAGEPQYPPYNVPVRIRDNTGETFQINTEPGSPVGPTPNFWNAYEFLKRFTDAERKAMNAAAAAGSDVQDFLKMLDVAASAGAPIIANDPQILKWMQVLVDGGLLTKDRRDAILSADG